MTWTPVHCNGLQGRFSTRSARCHLLCTLHGLLQIHILSTPASIFVTLKHISQRRRVACRHAASLFSFQTPPEHIHEVRKPVPWHLVGFVLHHHRLAVVRHPVQNSARISWRSGIQSCGSCDRCGKILSPRARLEQGGEEKDRRLIYTASSCARRMIA